MPRGRGADAGAARAGERASAHPASSPAPRRRATTPTTGCRWSTPSSMTKMRARARGRRRRRVRAAGGVPQQRPARRDARLRGAAPDLPPCGAPGEARGGRDRQRRRLPRGARPAGRRRRGGRRGGSARGAAPTAEAAALRSRGIEPCSATRVARGACRCRRASGRRDAVPHRCRRPGARRRSAHRLRWRRDERRLDACRRNLLYQAGTRMRYDEAVQQFVPAALPAGVFACGKVNGVYALEARLARRPARRQRGRRARRSWRRHAAVDDSRRSPRVAVAPVADRGASAGQELRRLRRGPAAQGLRRTRCRRASTTSSCSSASRPSAWARARASTRT